MFTGDKDIERKTRRIKSTIIFLKIHHYQDIKEVYSGLDKDGHVYLELQKREQGTSRNVFIRN